MPPTTLSFFRLGVPTLLLVAYLLFQKTNPIKHLNKPILFASSINGIRTYFYILAFTLTSIGNAVIMLYTWPIFVVLFSSVMLKEKISGKKALLAIFAFMGGALMLSTNQFSFENKDLIGMVAMVFSAMLYALTVPIFKKQLEKVSGTEAIFYQNFIGMFLFLPFLFISTPLPTLNASILGIVYAVVIGIVGFILFFAGLKGLKASTASLLSYIEVFSAMVIAFIFFNQQITAPMLVGGAMVLLSSFFIRNVE